MHLRRFASAPCALYALLFSRRTWLTCFKQLRCQLLSRRKGIGVVHFPVADGMRVRRSCNSSKGLVVRSGLRLPSSVRSWPVVLASSLQHPSRPLVSLRRRAPAMEQALREGRSADGVTQRQRLCRASGSEFYANSNQKREKVGTGCMRCTCVHEPLLSSATPSRSSRGRRCRDLAICPVPPAYIRPYGP